MGRVLRLYSARQIGGILGISSQQVRLIGERVGAGQRVGGAWVYTPGDLATIKQHRRPRGRPRIYGV